jgi:hypothetical protein
MELIYIASHEAHYNMDRLLKMQYESRKEEVLEGELLLMEGDRMFDDRRRTGKFTSASRLVLTFNTEPPDTINLTGEEADTIYEEVVKMSRGGSSAKESGSRA